MTIAMAVILISMRIVTMTKMTSCGPCDDHDNGGENDDGVLLVQTRKISRRLIAFQFSNYENIYSRAIHVLRMMMRMVRSVMVKNGLF